VISQQCLSRLLKLSVTEEIKLLETHCLIKQVITGEPLSASGFYVHPTDRFAGKGMGEILSWKSSLINIISFERIVIHYIYYNLILVSYLSGESKS
jgi:hypothetical protein